MYPIFIPINSCMNNCKVSDKEALAFFIVLDLICILNYFILFLIWVFKNKTVPGEYEEYSFIENVIGYNSYNVFACINSLFFIIANGSFLFCILVMFIYNLIK